jgi:2-(1,2-epoxy-1,2-dihydrophenyl)acetyl-CoA isomerase
MDDSILLQVEDRVAFVTFNRPGRLNAIDLGMARAFRETVDGLSLRDDVRAVVLRGAGAAFVAGGDIKLFGGDRDRAAATIAELIDHFHAATVGLQRLPAPVLASVHGAVAGGGFSLALAADFRIAADTATFTPAYLRLGASPDGGGTFFLPRLVGPSKALEMFLLGGTYSAADALRLGIVNRVVPAADLERETAALATAIAGGASPSLTRKRSSPGATSRACGVSWTPRGKHFSSACGRPISRREWRPSCPSGRHNSADSRRRTTPRPLSRGVRKALKSSACSACSAFHVIVRTPGFRPSSG